VSVLVMVRSDPFIGRMGVRRFASVVSSPIVWVQDHVLRGRWIEEVISDWAGWPARGVLSKGSKREKLVKKKRSTNFFAVLPVVDPPTAANHCGCLQRVHQSIPNASSPHTTILHPCCNRRWPNLRDDAAIRSWKSAPRLIFRSMAPCSLRYLGKVRFPPSPNDQRSNPLSMRFR
jgi:hypothetical protein